MIGPDLNDAATPRWHLAEMTGKNYMTCRRVRIQMLGEGPPMEVRPAVRGQMGATRSRTALGVPLVAPAVLGHPRSGRTRRARIAHVQSVVAAAGIRNAVAAGFVAIREGRNPGPI